MDATPRILAHPYLIVALALVAGLVGGGVVVGVRELAGSDDSPSGSAGPGCDVERVAAATLPSVVTLQVTTAEGEGNGSGVVVETTPGRPYILTNEHVVGSGDPGTDIRVIYSDGRSAVGHVVGADAVTDLAVVEGESDAPPVEVGSSGDLRIGQPVIALGAPLGLSSTVTTGIVSATDRYVRVPSAAGSSHHLVGAIQTDASINPGNSGGALVDCDGELVGINSAGASPPGDQGSVGLNFAIPSSLFTTIATELVDHGRVRHPTLGLQVAAVSVDTAKSTGLPTGLFVQAVVPGGPAEQAGLRPGDVIMELDGHRVSVPDDLVQIELEATIGQPVDVTFERAGEQQTVPVTPESAG